MFVFPVQGVKVYAGVEYEPRGREMATAVGKLCRWVENGNQPADFFPSYAAYQRSLFLNCDKGHSGRFTTKRESDNRIQECFLCCSACTHVNSR